MDNQKPAQGSEGFQEGEKNKGVFPSPTPFKVAEPPPPPSFDQTSEPEKQIKKPPTLLFVVIGIFVLGGIGFFVFKMFKKPQVSGEANLTYWGLWEEEAVMRMVIEDFEKEHPNIKVSYKKHSLKDFRGRVMAAIDKGQGPDVFRFHNTWLPMLKDYLAFIPDKIMSSSEFDQTFYPVAKKDLADQGKYYGLPLEIDGLALFYNEQLLNAAGLSPPTSWVDFQNHAFSLTVKDETGRIVTSGAALGTANNIDHFSDILGLIFLQNGANLANPTSEKAIEALTFYRIFAEPPQNTWDETLDSSILAFAQGEAAMIFAPSWQVFTIKAMNPNLSFKTAPVPQLPGVNINWASYWVEGVSSKSKYQEQAWQFLKYLTSKETMTFLYTEAAKQNENRLFGEPYSRKDLASTLINQPYVGPFISQAQTAESFYMCSRTFDNGINDQIIQYFEDAVNSLSEGKSPQSALETAAQGIQQVLGQYGLSVTSS